jgi:hypothetical protein
VIALVSLAATLLLYDLGVRRSPLTRFLFGLKQTHGPPPMTDAHSAHQDRQTSVPGALTAQPGTTVPPALRHGRRRHSSSH